ncbi:hypothetical protein EKK58_03610 [Candidatus Dependentiae bacterium]|nr:MAG: hypothetical protein EKK58_03610 [Candidatus Dependentiae bacterium]
MKYYVWVLYLLFANVLIGMENTDNVMVMPFRNTHNDNNSVHDMNEHHGPVKLATLNELRNFLEHHTENELLHSIEYLEKNLQVLPQVFAEFFFTKHDLDDSSKEIVTEKINTIMHTLFTTDTETYYHHLLNLVLAYKPSTEGSISFRNKPLHGAEEPLDPVKLLNGIKPLEALIVKELTEDNKGLKDKNNTQSVVAKGYQVAIAILTALSVIVPVVQQFLGNATNANDVQALVNCSHV